MDYNEDTTFGEVIHAMTKEKKDALYYVIGLYLSIAGPEKGSIEDTISFWKHSNQESQDHRTFSIIHSIHGAYWLAHMITKQNLDILRSFNDYENIVINKIVTDIVRSDKYRIPFPEDVQDLPYTTLYSADDVCSVTMIIPPN